MERAKLREAGFCIYCGMSIEKGELDHIIPLDRSGVDEIANLALTCTPCNKSKGSKPPMRWIRQQRLHIPSLAIRYRIQHGLSHIALTPFDSD